MHYPIIALMRGSHGLSAWRAWRTLSSRPDGPKAGPKGRSLKVGARRAPRLLVYYKGRRCSQIVHTFWSYFDFTLNHLNSWHPGSGFLTVLIGTSSEKFYGIIWEISQMSPAPPFGNLSFKNKFVCDVFKFDLRAIFFSITKILGNIPK